MGTRFIGHSPDTKDGEPSSRAHSDFLLRNISQVTEFSQEATLLVSSFPPSRCGIGTYAVGHFEWMKSKRQKILKATMLENSDADFHFNFSTLSGLLSWWRFCHTLKSKSVFVHYCDNYFFPTPVSPRWASVACRLLQMDAMRALARSAQGESCLIIHEISLSEHLPAWARRVRFRALSRFDRIEFHTRHLADEFLKFFPNIPGSKAHVVEHTRFMVPSFIGSREKAREELGLPPDKTLFLCIGLIHFAKGFDMAIQSFGKSASFSAELHIVGMPSPNDDYAESYMKSLWALAESTPGVHLHEGYIDDVTFDKWVCAASAVILPYRSIASSSVGARASLYKTPLIISDIPNLQEQFPKASIFSDTGELATLIKQLSA